MSSRGAEYATAEFLIWKKQNPDATDKEINRKAEELAVKYGLNERRDDGKSS